MVRIVRQGLGARAQEARGQDERLVLLRARWLCSVGFLTTVLYSLLEEHSFGEYVAVTIALLVLPIFANEIVESLTGEAAWDFG
jgi:hypothetical protein